LTTYNLKIDWEKGKVKMIRYPLLYRKRMRIQEKRREIKEDKQKMIR